MRSEEPKPELSEAQLTELRGDLEALARELQQSLDDNASAARPVELDQPAMGRVSRIDAIQQQKMSVANRESQRMRLQGVRSAVRRCEEDEYGDCLGCSEGIGFARLKARPETLFCIACQTARER